MPKTTAQAIIQRNTQWEDNVKRDTQDGLDGLFRAMVGKTITYREMVS